MRVFDNFGVFKYSVFRYQYLNTLLVENQTRNNDEYIDTLEYLAIYSKTKRHLIISFRFRQVKIEYFHQLNNTKLTKLNSEEVEVMI